MAISRVGLVTLATGATTGWACALPAGLADGDRIYVFLAKATNAAPTLPAGEGYALLDPVDVSSTQALFCYGATLQAADASTTHTWAWASARTGACALILRGADAALDVPDPPTGAAANGTSVVLPASTVATAGAWVLWATSHAVDATHTFPGTSGGNAVTREVGGTAGASGLGWATYPAAASVPSIVVTLSVTGRAVGKTLIVKPAAAAPAGAATRRWTGSAWTPAAAQRWDGGAWVPATVKRWDGTGWV